MTIASNAWNTTITSNAWNMTSEDLETQAKIVIFYMTLLYVIE